VRSEQHELPAGWELVVEDDDIVKEGAILAQDPESEKVLESGLAGQIYLEENRIFIRAELEDVRDYDIPQSARLLEDVHDGMQVTAGQQLTEGSKNPHRILRILGQDAAEHYLLNEVQKVYRNQGVNIADKHFEVVIRKMMSKVQITRSGDSELLPGELIDKLLLLRMNERLTSEGKDAAAGVPVLLGVTKAALTTDSFLSASSFQHTIKVLAGAAIEGKVDRLYGLKENVIIGKLIPAGTGFQNYQDRDIAVDKDELEAKYVLRGDAEEDEEDDEDMMEDVEDLAELGKHVVDEDDELPIDDFEDADEEDLEEEHDLEDADEVLVEDEEEEMESFEAVADEEEEEVEEEDFRGE